MKHFGSTSGLTLLAEDQATPANGMVAYVTSSYNSGYQNGDIKGAFLADTDDTDLVGSGELVTNGTFDTDTSGWTFEGSATNTSAAGYLEGITGSAINVLAASSITTVIGKTYVLTCDLVSTDNVGAIAAGSTIYAQNLGITGYMTSGSVGTFTFKATTTLTYITVLAGTANKTVRVDNISVKLADADRSANNNGLIVTGTITRSPVATGAELVAYSGFAASNYLEQPYNADLDFGTGDFCVMGWVNASTFNAVDAYVVRSSVSTAGGGWLFGAASGTLKFWNTPNSGYAAAITGSLLPLNTWNHAVIVRKSGVLYVYQNGQLTASASFTSDISHSTPAVSLGFDSDFGSYAAGATKMALLRISATAPTADQILKIYNDEKVLFQDNAACTLYGASDAVTALAHDPDTGLLHVGTSAGRSVFDGLRRIDNTTDAVTTAISASGGMIAEQ